MSESKDRAAPRKVGRTAILAALLLSACGGSNPDAPEVADCTPAAGSTVPKCEGDRAAAHQSMEAA